MLPSTKTNSSRKPLKTPPKQSRKGRVVKWLGVLSAGAALIVTVSYVPIPGRPLQAPRQIALVDAEGNVLRTGVAVMLVSLENEPSLARRALLSNDLVWNSLSTKLGWVLDGRAGDDAQAQARSSAWFVAQSMLGGDIGVELAGAGLPEGLKPGDVVLKADGKPVSMETLIEALSRPRGLDTAGGGPPPRTLLESMKQSQKEGERLASLTVLRRGKVVEATVKKQMVSPALILREWTWQKNPYTVPSLTGVSGASAGLGLTLGYLSATSGADLASAGAVAATGSLHVGLDGSATIQEISGLDDKLQAAIGAGFPILAVPLQQLEEAEGIVGGRATLIGAATIEGAVTALCLLGADCQGLPVRLRHASVSEFAIVPAGVR